MADIIQDIAYRVENGIITNTVIVDPSEPLEEGFIKSKWRLGIGYVYNDSLKDYYPEGVTEEVYNTKVTELNDSIESTIVRYTNIINELDTINSLPDTVDEVKQINNERKARAKRYIEYLKTANTTIENAFYQTIKSYEEI